jgi:hypothetical protein
MHLKGFHLEMEAGVGKLLLGMETGEQAGSLPGSGSVLERDIWPYSPQRPGLLRTVKLILSAVPLHPSSRVTDLVNQQQTLEEKMREDRDSLVERLHRQTAEYSAFKLENERLKVCWPGEGTWVENSKAKGGQAWVLLTGF